MNTSAVDGWTLVHAGVGVVAGRMGLRPGVVLVLGITYEILEHGVESTPSGQALFDSDGPEVFANAVTDVAVMMAAFHLARRR